MPKFAKDYEPGDVVYDIQGRERVVVLTNTDDDPSMVRITTTATTVGQLPRSSHYFEADEYIDRWFEF